jgi:membrane-bound lytic murein transglycosylase D
LKRFRSHIVALLAGVLSLHADAQVNWRMDSLMSTWTVQHQMPGLRVRTRAPLDWERDKEDVHALLQRAAPAFPVFEDSAVIASIERYGGPERDLFRALLGVADKHFGMIDREIAALGLPAELRYLPLALSAMNTLATSRTGEAGCWMLPWPVALRYGLVVTHTVDERHDVARSTRAALLRLRDLHAYYNDWPTAVTAFACGPANLTRANGKVGDVGARELHAHMSSGHRDVLPLLMAFTYLATNAERFDLEPYAVRATEPADTVRFDSTLVIDVLNRIVGIPPARFRSMNPCWMGKSLPPGTPFVLNRSDAERFTELAFIVLEAQDTSSREVLADAATSETIERLPDGREAILVRVGTSDCINCISERFNVEVTEIMAWNELQSDQLEVGNTVVLYVQPDQRLKYETDLPPELLVRTDTMPAVLRTDTVLVQPKPLPKPEPKERAKGSTYTVRKGDSLYGIAKRYPGVSADDLMRYNKIGEGIRPGQRIKIPPAR